MATENDGSGDALATEDVRRMSTDGENLEAWLAAVARRPRWKVEPVWDASAYPIGSVTTETSSGKQWRVVGHALNVSVLAGKVDVLELEEVL